MKGQQGSQLKLIAWDAYTCSITASTAAPPTCSFETKGWAMTPSLATANETLQRICLQH